MARRRRSDQAPVSGPVISRREVLAGAGVAAAGVTVALYGPSPRSTAELATGVRNPTRSADDWASVREAFDLDDDVIHMSAMLIAAHPRSVREAIARHRRRLDRDPVGYLSGHNRRLHEATLRAAARYLGGAPEEIALTDSTTMGLGLIYNGVRLRADQEILTTEHDYFVTHESARLGAERAGASTRRISLFARLDQISTAEIVERIVRAIEPRTRLLGLTWVHSSTGLELPLADIADAVAAINRDRDEDDRVLICVDGVHGFGVEDVDVAGLGIDFFAAGCHKWLFGPRGSGLVWGRPESWAATRPIIPSFSASEVHRAWLEQSHPPSPTTAAMMSPGGFQTFEHQWALAEAFQFHLDLGRARVAERTHALARRCKDGLRELRGVTVHTPASDELSAGIVAFDIDDVGPWTAVRRLRRAGITATVAPYRSRHVRLTPSIVNTPDEVDRAVRAVADLT